MKRFCNRNGRVILYPETSEMYMMVVRDFFFGGDNRDTEIAGRHGIKAMQVKGILTRYFEINKSEFYRNYEKV